MPSIRDRLANALLGPQKREMIEAFRDITGFFYLGGPFEPGTSPQALKARLQEYDSALLQDLVNEIEWERIGGLGYDLFTGEQRRVRAVKESRRLWMLDVVSAFVVQLWTDFGFGENIKVTPEDEAGQVVWEEFWGAERNDAVLAQDKIQKLSETVMVDGDLILGYYVSTIDGMVTVRPIDGLEITDVITDPDDSKKELLYRRQWIGANGTPMTALYPDWQPWLDWKRNPAHADPFAKLANDGRVKDVARADTLKPETIVVIQKVAYRDRGTMRGWPLMMAGAPWIREHRRFRENRAAVAAGLAMFIQKIKTKGGSRGIDAVKRKMQSSLAGSLTSVETNPPAVPGSTFLENDAAELTRLPLSSAASDAKVDGASLLQMAGLSGGIFPHWLGEGDSYRLATATSMEQPVLRQFSRYKLFWSAQFRRMVKIVLGMAQLYGSNQRIESTGAEVSTDRLIETDLEAISSGIGGLLTDALQPYYENGLIDDNVVREILAAIWRVALQAMGVEDAEEVASDEAFGVEAKPEEAAIAENRRPFKSADPTVARRLRMQELGWRRTLRTTAAGRLLSEAGWQGLSELSSHQGDYLAGLRAAIRGLWSGATTWYDAFEALRLVIEVGLRWAWIEGMAQAGIGQAEISLEEWDIWQTAVNAEVQHIPGLLEFVESNSHARGGKLETCYGRIDLWANRYNDIVNRAKVTAASNPKLKWRIGGTKEHCKDCATYEGRVYRAKSWEKVGAMPQSHDLECGGWKCQCRLDPTDEPCWPGLPPRPTG